MATAGAILLTSTAFASVHQQITTVNLTVQLIPTATVQFELEDQQILVNIVRLDVSGLSVARSLVEKQMDELQTEIQGPIE